jgi:hypothetical protein
LCKKLKGNSEANYTNAWHEEGVGCIPLAAAHKAVSATKEAATAAAAAATTKCM